MILLDTTVLNNFAQIQRPDLLQLVFPDAATTELVMKELEQGISLGSVPKCDWAWLTVIELSQTEQTDFERICEVLDDGEASCIAAARERGAVVFTDDLPARSFARQESIRISGSLGMLVALVAGGHLDVRDADRLLGQMVALGYRSPVLSIGDLDLSGPQQ